ncbi:MAG: heat-inducible transcription repressor HrcA [Clostridia bacterium]|nr:heat-inducible transcription repressor HrcA [Clostridia bacterium]
MRIGDDLSDRKKAILRALIDAHIENGEPVGSKYLTSCDIGCSSATIRNEMSELEQMGYLEQPHTSAGRVPSKAGYRFYVDSLMRAYSLTARELETLNNMQKARLSQLDKMIKAAGKLITSMTNYPTVSVKPKFKDQTVNCFKTTFVDSRNFILSMIMSGDVVRSRYIHCKIEVTEEVLNRLCGVLNNNIAHKTSSEITLPLIMKMENDMGVDDALISSVIKNVYDVMSSDDEGELKYEGVDKLLEYPEFSDLGNLKDLLSFMDKKEQIMQLVENDKNDNVSIYIGGEDSSLSANSSIILKTFKVDGKVVGAIGVIGPQRMEYPKVVAMVEYLAKCISSTLEIPDVKELRPPDSDT